MLPIDLSGCESSKYKIINKLGAGSYGEVYRAYNKILREYCALKIIPMQDQERAALIYKEAEIPNKCRHSNIISVKTADPITINTEKEILHALAIEMELLNGGSLEWLLQNKFVPIIDSVNYAVSILSGLEFAHINKVIHGDIKPGNILLDEYNNPKLSDFGLAFFTNACPPDGMNINFYVSHGAPELRNQLCKPNVLTDIYAFGVTFFRMVNNISNWKYIKAVNPNIAYAIQTGEFGGKILYRPYVPGKIIRIISKACNPNPLKRYQTVAEMRDALLKLHLCHNWHPLENNEFKWQAEDPSGCIYLAEIQQTGRGGYAFQLKKNNRRISRFCCEYASLGEAKDCLYNFLSKYTVK
jgi:serine/threonine protein kinase